MKVQKIPATMRNTSMPKNNDNQNNNNKHNIKVVSWNLIINCTQGKH